MDDRRQHSRHTAQLNIEALDLHSGRILGAEALDEETANAIVMAARRQAGWFGDEEETGDEQQG